MIFGWDFARIKKTTVKQWLTYAAIWAGILACIVLVYWVFSLDKYGFRGKGRAPAKEVHSLFGGL